MLLLDKGHLYSKLLDKPEKKISWQTTATVNPLFLDIYEKEVDDLIHQMVYGCNLPESSRCEDNESLKSKHTNKIEAKTAAKIAARDAKARKAKNKCMPCFCNLFMKLKFLCFICIQLQLCQKLKKKLRR